MGAEQAKEGDLITLRRYPLGEGAGADFSLPDGTVVTLNRKKTNDNASLTWPVTAGAKDFLDKASKTVGIALPEQVTVTTIELVEGEERYADSLVDTSDLSQAFEEETSVSFFTPDKKIRICWFNTSLSTEQCMEGGIQVPDLTAIDPSELSELIVSTGNEGVVANQAELIDKVLNEINIDITYLN